MINLDLSDIAPSSNAAKAGYATNSFNVVFKPKSSPAITASFHGIPINQVIGANKYPSVNSIDKLIPK